MLHLYHDVPQCKHCGSYKTAYSVPNTKNPFQNVMKHLRKGEYIYEDEDGIFNCLCLNCGMQWKAEIPSKISPRVLLITASISAISGSAFSVSLILFARRSLAQVCREMSPFSSNWSSVRTNEGCSMPIALAN